MNFPFRNIMINPFTEINWQPEKKDIISFGRSMLIGFTVISTIFLIVNLFIIPFNEALYWPTLLFSVGALLYLISNAGVTIAKPFYLVWFFLSATIGIMVSNLLLTMFYYLFFSVFAVIFRLTTGRDPLKLKKDLNKKSWWVEIKEEKSLKRYFKQY